MCYVAANQSFHAVSYFDLKITSNGKIALDYSSLLMVMPPNGVVFPTYESCAGFIKLSGDFTLKPVSQMYCIEPTNVVSSNVVAILETLYHEGNKNALHSHN